MFKDEQKSKPFKALVVGLGSIGQQLDAESITDSVLTHAQAFTSHPDFSLVGGIDSDSEARKNFERRFSTPAYSSLEDFLIRDQRETQIDVVALSVSASKQPALYEQILSFKPKLVLLEKPLAASRSDAERLLKAATLSKTPTAVNYIRRFSRGFQHLKSMIQNEELGTIRKVLVWYSKGLFNNASHFIDWLIDVFGKVESVELLAASKHSTLLGDPEPDFVIKFKNLSVYFLAGHEEDHSIKEMEILGSKGRALVRRGGEQILFEPTENSSLFPGYKVLSLDAQNLNSEFHRYQWDVADAISKHLRLGKPLASRVETAMETLNVCERIALLCQA